MTRTLLFALALIACGGEKGSDTADTGASAAPTPAGTGSGGTGTGSGGTASGWTAGTGTGTGTGMGSAGTGTGTGSAGTGTGTGSAGTGTGSTGTGTGSTGTGTGTGATGTGTGSTPVDADGDGYAAPDDCDDTDDTVFPGAAESCDLVDSDCDGDLVEGFDDLDGDHTPDCVDADPCTPAPDDLVVWFRGDFDLIDSMGTSWLDDAYSYGGLFTGGVVGGAFDLEPSWYALDWDADPWLVSPIAIEAWVKTTPASADPWGAVPHQTVLAHYECAGPCAVGPSGLSPSLYILRVNAAGHAEFLIRDADAGHGVPTDVVEGATDLTDDRWHHLLAVLDADAGSLQLYVDGVPDADPHALVHNDGSGFAQDDAWDTDPITIGFQGEASTGMPVHLWRGAIDELSVYAGALTADDAADLYMAGIAGKCR